MSLDESLLIKKEDVIKEDISYNRGCGTYLRKLSPHIERFKALIKGSSSGEIEVKIRDLKSLMGEEFKDVVVNSFYSRVKDILLEFGIKVKLHHHYGANLILSLASEGEIRPSIDAGRERILKTAKNAGYDGTAEYFRDAPSERKRHLTDMRYDKENKFYLVYIGKKYIAPILYPGAIINKHSLGSRLTVSGYDWEASIIGLKIKHIGSHLQHGIVDDYERNFFQWSIGNNEIADVFLLTGWGNVEEVGEGREGRGGKGGLIKAWVFNKGDIINNREFWDRVSFLISTHKRSLKKYSEYEVSKEKLEKIRERLESVSQLDIDMDVDIDKVDIDVTKDESIDCN
ncbi:MAG: hypothetical protein LAN71_17155 [Acidobacteriia bacterium]|nr:hypothetical protein [Terriglobia bacterium]